MLPLKSLDIFFNLEVMFYCYIYNLNKRPPVLTDIKVGYQQYLDSHEILTLPHTSSK